MKATITRIRRAGGLIIADFVLWEEYERQPDPDVPPYRERLTFFTGSVAVQDESQVEEAIRVKARELAAEALARAFARPKVIDL